MNLSTEVVEDYELNPSEISGSVIQVSENSPFLDDKIKGNGWRKVINDSISNIINTIKNGKSNDTE